MNLTTQEKKVLLALKEKHRQSFAELVKASKIGEDSVNRACAWLSAKGLVGLDEKIHEEITLGREGKIYLEKGLPERQLIDYVKEDEKTVKELNEKLGAEIMKIGSVWLRKDNLAIIAQGKIKLTPKGKKHMKKKMPSEEVLAHVSKNENVTHELMSELKKLRRRGKILKIVEKKEKEIEITAKGLELGKEDLKLEEEVSLLTPGLIKTGKWKDVKLRKYDIKAPVPVIHPGKKQMYKAFLDETKEILISMGFKEAKGPLVETEFWNFDALYQAQNHPSREVHDVYYIKAPKSGELPKEEYVENIRNTHENGWTTKSKGWGYKWNPAKAAQLLLRSHTTSVSAREMAKKPEIPSRIFCLGKNFRPDVIDATHLPELYQLDGIVMGEGLTFRDLLGILKSLVNEIAGVQETKFKAAYFPFTEPSVEIFGKHPKIGWIELAGAGIFRPEVTLPLGIEVPVLAWAFGVDRLAMFKLGLNDIRELYSKDLETLRKAVI